MSIYDIIMLVVLVGSIMYGLWKGLAWQVASLASLFVSYFVALNFRGALAPYISASEPWNRFAAMLILFLATSLIIWMGYGYMQKTIKRLNLRGFDTQAGALLGGFTGVLLCMLITLFSVTLFGTNVREAVIASKSGGYIAAGINRLNAMVPQEIHTVLNQHVETFNENLAEQDPEFLNRSNRKLEERIHTIRGKFKLPDSTSDQFGDLNGIQIGDARGGVDSTLVHPTTEQNIGGNEMKDAGDEILNAAKEAGKKFIEDNLNR